MDDLVDPLDDPGDVFIGLLGPSYMVSLRIEQADTLVTGKLLDRVLDQHPVITGSFTNKLDIANE